jgi:hypothetical protein
MEWRVITEGKRREGIQRLAIVPAGLQEPTFEEWQAIRKIIEEAVKKASS